MLATAATFQFRSKYTATQEQPTAFKFKVTNEFFD